MEANTHLFSLPKPRGDSESTKDYEGRCYANDVDGLSVIVRAVKRLLIREADLKRFKFYPGELLHVAVRVTQLLEAYKNPGPFKKAAALTIALLENPAVGYMRDSVADPITEWKLQVFISAKVSQLFLINAFASHTNGKPVIAPKWPSKHFMGDFLRYMLTTVTEKDLVPLAMHWELMTYYANHGINKLNGIIDRECELDKLPGIDYPFSAIPGIDEDHKEPPAPPPPTRGPV